MKSFLQTIEWLDFQKHLGRATWRFDNGKIKANIIKHDLPFRKNYLYIPHGPEVDFNAITGTVGNEIAQFVSYLKNLAREQKSIFVKAEPLDDKVPEAMHRFGLKKSSKEIQPRKTVVLDLDKSEEELLSQMRHKTRYNIKVAEKHNVEVREGSDIDAFLKLLSKTVKRQRFSMHPTGYYKELFEFFNNNPDIRSSIFIATFEGKPVAGALMLIYKDTAYYLHGGSDHDHRDVMAPYAMHWYLIIEMKKRGFKHYDFGGSEGSKWPGVTRFKLGWGGETKEYPGSFDIPVSSIWYLIYRIARKIF